MEGQPSAGGGRPSRARASSTWRVRAPAPRQGRRSYARQAQAGGSSRHHRDREASRRGNGVEEDQARPRLERRQPRQGQAPTLRQALKPAQATSSEPGHSSSQRSRPYSTTSTAAPVRSRSTAAGEPVCSTHSAAHDRTVSSGSTTASSTSSRPTLPKAHQSKSANPASRRVSAIGSETGRLAKRRSTPP